MDDEKKSRRVAHHIDASLGQLRALMDEMGVVAPHEREKREEDLFSAIVDALDNRLRLASSEKKQMVDQAKNTIALIRQMELSLHGPNATAMMGPDDDDDDDDDLQVTYPLTRCLQMLRDKHAHVSRLHRERFEQIKKLVDALVSYSSHLEPSFVNIALPPIAPGQSVPPPSFDLSPAYVDKLDAEFTRVYDEYTRRIALVQTLSDHIIQLWVELGTPQAQQDSAIVQYYRDAPEQLGLHDQDLARLQAKRDRLADDKRNRERRLRDLGAAVETLWDKLGVDEADTRAFLNRNRGCGLRQINEYEDELGRLHELKRQNLHLFVEDARVRLQDLWDALYLSEDEMLEFTPAFSDVYSDALLEAHEREVARLEALREQRAPLLALVDRHKALLRDRDELTASSQDASRLMMRGSNNKGERRDPGKLLREEKTRKRVAKELPKATAELRRALAQWEDEYGRPFLVFGTRYLEQLDADEEMTSTGTTRPQSSSSRSKTPAAAAASSSCASSSSSTSRPKSAELSRGNSTLRSRPKSAELGRANSVRSTAGPPPPPSRSMTKTPTGNSNHHHHHHQSNNNKTTSPSRLPARVPLSNLKHGANSPERSREPTFIIRNGAPPRAPPPKMRTLGPVPELSASCGSGRSSSSDGSHVMVRQVEPEDVYDDDGCGGGGGSSGHSSVGGGRYAGSSRHTSHTSSSTENWETYVDDDSDPEPDASEAYYAKLRAVGVGGGRRRFESTMVGGGGGGSSSLRMAEGGGGGDGILSGRG
ncbi:hypothetical protein CP532_1346 [Ophiocordyceps camponoti-leonardi (nom. inval.)]|nr:hypothetical protein CP532_1346 [Ophiocordyceps camponoti-leonardi (nom. inval.)]